MKPILKANALKTIGLCLLTGLMVYIFTDDHEVFIESKESKTTLGGPVFNKIRLLSFKDKDVWMMNQSHHGSLLQESSWDRLAIVVDKSKSPYVARFYQLEPGTLNWKDELTERPYKVSCFVCHNNGPRAIRPNYESPFDPTSLRDRLKIAYWNRKIKLYGRVVPDPIHDLRDQTAIPPFRFRSTYENEPLKVATCTLCHKESGFLARGLLRRQQLPTIRFMLESGQMLPLDMSLSSKEKLELQIFLDGF